MNGHRDILPKQQKNIQNKNLIFYKIIQFYKNLHFLSDYDATEEGDIIIEIWAKFCQMSFIICPLCINEKVPERISWCMSQMNVSVLLRKKKEIYVLLTRALRYNILGKNACILAIISDASILYFCFILFLHFFQRTNY